MERSRNQDFVNKLSKDALRKLSLAKTTKDVGYIVGELAATAFNSGLVIAQDEAAKDIPRLYYGGAYDAAAKLSRLNLN